MRSVGSISLAFRTRLSPRFVRLVSGAWPSQGPRRPSSSEKIARPDRWHKIDQAQPQCGCAPCISDAQVEAATTEEGYETPLPKIPRPSPASAKGSDRGILLAVEERPAKDPEERTAAKVRGESPADSGITAAAERGGSGWVNTDVAAAALDVSPRTVRDYIAAGKLAARSEGAGVQKRHLISIDSLQAMLDARRREPAVAPRNSREDLASLNAAMYAADNAEVSAAHALRELIIRLEARTAEAADAKARLELTERAESTLREALEREKEERRLAREEADRLRDELDAERSKGFWRRLFGG